MTERMKKFIGKLMTEDVPFEILNSDEIWRVVSTNFINGHYDWAFSDRVFVVHRSSYRLQDISDEKLLEYVINAEREKK